MRKVERKNQMPLQGDPETHEERYVLDNGLRVIVFEDANAVKSMVRFTVGDVGQNTNGGISGLPNLVYELILQKQNIDSLYNFIKKGQNYIADSIDFNLSHLFFHIQHEKLDETLLKLVETFKSLNLENISRYIQNLRNIYPQKSNENIQYLEKYFFTDHHFIATTPEYHKPIADIDVNTIQEYFNHHYSADKMTLMIYTKNKIKPDSLLAFNHLPQKKESNPKIENFNYDPEKIKNILIVENTEVYYDIIRFSWVISIPNHLFNIFIRILSIAFTSKSTGTFKEILSKKNWVASIQLEHNTLKTNKKETHTQIIIHLGCCSDAFLLMDDIQIELGRYLKYLSMSLSRFFQDAQYQIKFQNLHQMLITEMQMPLESGKIIIYIDKTDEAFSCYPDQLNQYDETTIPHVQAIFQKMRIEEAAITYHMLIKTFGEKYSNIPKCVDEYLNKHFILQKRNELQPYEASQIEIPNNSYFTTLPIPYFREGQPKIIIQKEHISKLQNNNIKFYYVPNLQFSHSRQVHLAISFKSIFSQDLENEAKYLHQYTNTPYHPLNIFLSHAYVILLSNIRSELSSAHYKFQDDVVNFNHFLINLVGAPSKIGLAIQNVLEIMRKFELSQESFDFLKQDILNVLSKLQRQEGTNALQVMHHCINQLFIGKKVQYDEYRMQIEKFTLSELKHFQVTQFYQKEFKLLIGGNLSKDSALDIYENNILPIFEYKNAKKNMKEEKTPSNFYAYMPLTIYHKTEKTQTNLVNMYLILKNIPLIEQSNLLEKHPIFFEELNFEERYTHANQICTSIITSIFNFYFKNAMLQFSKNAGVTIDIPYLLFQIESQSKTISEMNILICDFLNAFQYFLTKTTDTICEETYRSFEKCFENLSQNLITIKQGYTQTIERNHSFDSMFDIYSAVWKHNDRFDFKPIIREYQEKILKLLDYSFIKSALLSILSDYSNRLTVLVGKDNQFIKPANAHPVTNYFYDTELKKPMERISDYCFHQLKEFTQLCDDPKLKNYAKHILQFRNKARLLELNSPEKRALQLLTSKSQNAQRYTDYILALEFQKDLHFKDAKMLKNIYVAIIANKLGETKSKRLTYVYSFLEKYISNAAHEISKHAHETALSKSFNQIVLKSNNPQRFQIWSKVKTEIDNTAFIKQQALKYELLILKYFTRDTTSFSDLYLDYLKDEIKLKISSGVRNRFEEFFKDWDQTLPDREQREKASRLTNPFTFA